jgi:hypothetical protein
MIKFSVASICTAFESKTIGTKVLDKDAFLAALGAAVEKYEMPESGHAFVAVDAVGLVSCGVARDPAGFTETDVVAREHRGHWAVYARRDKASKADSVACVVFTREAYLADPDVQESLAEGITHVIVAVLAFAGPKSPLPIWTLVHNIAGGNAEFVPAGLDERDPTRNLNLLYKIIGMARESENYWSEWMVVAD